MAECILRDSTVIGDFIKPYFVAEVNTSHNGSIETAKEMIDQAKAVGCSCVKFQSWSKESLYSKTYYKENPIAGRIVKKFAFSEAQLMEVAQHCKKR
jgi:N-acetylneuraminate synthase